MNDTNVKQILFKLKGELNDKHEEIVEAMEALYVKGRSVGFKHGKGIIRGKVYCVGSNKDCFSINIKVDSSGNHKWVHHAQLARLD